LSPSFSFYRLVVNFGKCEHDESNGLIFQEAMKQITQLLPEDFRKELYELWEVSTLLGYF
jgi:hypothetical protein